MLHPDLTQAIATKVDRMSASELNFAIKDIQKCLAIWRDEPNAAEYCQKLWHEFDLATTRRQRLVRGQ
jgi:hypothetical protein